MRHAFAAFVLNLGLALPAAALEIEEERIFGPEDALRSLSVLSTTDIGIFAPVLEGYLAEVPDIRLHYVVASSKDIHDAIAGGAEGYDLVISSAMDLQIKLANDGFAAAHRSSETAAVPGWSHWRDLLYGIAQDPVVLLISRRDFTDLPVPRTRRDLLELLRDNSERFRGRIAMYDPEVSGAGYMFFTQDARQTDTFWRLAEVMGRLDPQLVCCSSEMTGRVERGEVGLAYNALGSYAATYFSENSNGEVVELQDFTHAVLRTALIPKTAPQPEEGGRFLDFLLSPRGQDLIANEAHLPPLEDTKVAERPNLRPIRLDPGLLVYLDRLTRENFLGEWRGAMDQN